MAILVDPRTGQQFEGPDENVEEATKRFGFVTPEAYAETQRQEQLQAEHGGEKLETFVGSAEEQAAHRLSQMSALAGDVDAMGNPINTVEPLSTETVANIVPGLGGANAPELKAQQEANPVSAGLGKAAADLPIYAAAGAATGGLGTGVGSGLGLAEGGAAVLGAATSATALGAGQEVEAAHEEHRPIDIENIGKNVAFNVLFEGAGYAGGKVLGKLFGRAKPLEQAVDASLERAGTAAEDLGNPEVLSRARAETVTKIEETATKLEDAAASVKPVVANNPLLQKSAIQNLSEQLPELAEDLEGAMKRPRAQRFQTLLDLRAEADSPQAQELLDSVISDRSLWGDAAVDHAATVQAIGDARAAGPQALADAARGIKDPTVERLVGELDSHFEDMHRFAAAEAFPDSGLRQSAQAEHASTVGAADRNFDASDYDKARAEVLDKDTSALHVANESDALLKDASQNTARALDTVNEALQTDLSVGEKYPMWEAEAEKWSARKVAAQTRWIEDRVLQAKDAAEAINNMSASGFDGKSYAAQVLDTIATTEKRLAGAASPLERAEIAENAKRAYDRLVMKLGKLPETALETPVKNKLIEQVKPLAKSLRDGFEDAKLFGSKVARYQARANAAYHKLIEPLADVNHMLTERLPMTYEAAGTTNARGSAALQSKIENQMRTYLGGGVRAQDRMATALEGVQELIAAKKAAGASPAQLSRLRQVERAIQSMHDDQQLASVIRTAMTNAEKAGHGHVFAGAGVAESLGVAMAGHVIDAAALHTIGPIGRPMRFIIEPAAAKYLTGLRKGLQKTLGLTAKAPEFGEKGGALRSIIEGHAHRYARNLSDLHGNSSYASETFGNKAPAYTALLKKRGANLALGAAEAAPRVIPPSGGPGPAASAVPSRGGAPPDVGGGSAANDAAERVAAARRQAGAVVVQGEPAAKIDRLATKLRDRLEKFSALEKKGVPEGRLDDARADVNGALHDLRDEYSARLAETLDGRTPEELGPKARAKYDRLKAGADELERLLGEHGGKTEQVDLGGGKTAESYAMGDPIKSAEAYLSGRKTIDTEAGHVTAGDLATSPMALASGAGALGLGGYKAYQFLEEPEQTGPTQDDQHAQYLAQAGARDTLATARALTDPAAASEYARRSRGQPSTLEQFQGEHETLQQAFTAQRATVEKAMRDPSAIVDSLGDAFGGLSPELRDKLSAKALQLASYSYQELPPQRGVSASRPQGLPPHPLEARSWALKTMTAFKPSTAFDDAKRGTLRHEQVESLKANWPELYSDLRAQTLTAMTSGKASIQQKQRNDLLFGFGAALDPAFSPRISAAANQARQAQPTAAAPSGAPAKSKTTANLQPDGLAALAK